MDRWSRTVLGDVLKIEHGFAFKGKYFDPAGSRILLTPKNFKASGGLDVTESRCKFYEGPVEGRFVLGSGDVVVAMTDLKQDAPILGSAGIVPEGERYLHNQRIGKVKIRDEDRLDRRFAPWLLNSPVVREAVRSSATGATVRHTAPARIEAVAVSLPPVPTQRRIAMTLSAFDELVAGNERRIELLEDLARSLYREWFVHFRFPGHINGELVEGDAGPIPKGWSLSRLADFAEVVVDGVEPSEFEVSDRHVGLEHLSRRSTTLHRWGSTKTVRSRKLRFARGDTLFGKIRPNLHKVAWAPFPGLASSDTVIVRPRNGLTGFVNALASSDRFVAEAVATANGTKMPRADPRAMLAYEVVVPDEGSSLLVQFNQAIERWLSWSGELVQVNQMLVATRDLLLPRLVTGQLDISDVDLGALTPPDPQ
jgi:type I restriction enzyme, S subunit